MMTDSEAIPEHTRMLTSPNSTPVWAESAGEVTCRALVFDRALGWDKQFERAGVAGGSQGDVMRSLHAVLAYLFCVVYAVRAPPSIPSTDHGMH